MGFFSGLALVAIVVFILIAAGAFYLLYARTRQQVRELESGAQPLHESEDSRSPTLEVLDDSQVGIAILNADLTVVWVNRVLERYFDIGREEMVGKTRAQFVERVKNIFEDPPGFAQKVLAKYGDNTYREQFECQVLADKGREERWLEYRSQPITTGLYAGGWSEQYYDVSERVQAQKAFVQAQKMEAVGKLTSGVAHDFNNLLTVIIGNLQLLEAQVEDQSRLAGMVKTALRRARQGTELTEKLRMFSRTRPLDAREIDLNQHLRHLTELLRQILEANIQVKLVSGEHLWRVKVDLGQLETAVVNLAMNARDAMPDGGDLTFETSNISLDDSHAARQFDVTPGHYVLLSVSDTGVGMAPENLKRAFEPFFSTKKSAVRKSGDGSGLGLSMVYGFAKQSGGQVGLYSQPGQGTTVKLLLPKIGDNE